MFKHIKKTIEKPAAKIIITIFLLSGAIITGYSLLKNNAAGNAEIDEKPVAEVATAKIDLLAETATFIKTVGTVRPESQVDVVANTGGTVRGLFFDIGDDILLNQPLAFLYDSSTLTSQNNAQTNYINMQGNLLATERISNEAVSQAELGVQAAQDSIQAAEIGLKAAEDTLKNAKALSDKNSIDLKNSANVSFNGYLNTIFGALDQVNYIIKAEGNIQLPFIEPVLGVKNLESVSIARNKYLITKESYNKLSGLELTPDNISDNMEKLSQTLALAQELVDNTITVLDNTITDENFNSASLAAQKTVISALRITVVSAQSGAQSTYQSLENISLVRDREISALENAVSASENQLQKTQTAYENALVALENAKKARDQQLLMSKSSLDNAAGQLNLAQNQSSDLNVKAPISGQITGKFVEVGTDVKAGQKIAQVSALNSLKIEASLPSEEIYLVTAGQEVTIGEDLKATIALIGPAADPITRKVKIEIFYDNKDNNLIPGTFIDVLIPVRKLEKTHAESVFVPLRAVIIAPEGSFVFKAVPGDTDQVKIARKTVVTTGKTEGALIEILNGLDTGDELIVDGAKNLEDSDLIKVIQ